MASHASSSDTYVTDLTAFLTSPEAAPISDPEWTCMSQPIMRAIREQFSNNEELFQIFVYNKSRSVDRICPYCRKHYQAIDTFKNIESNVTGSYTSLEFEQALSGICSLECFHGLNGSTAMDELFGKSADAVYIVQ